jgi:4-hydroxy-tetrahydrodipicolinate reductase
MGSRICALAMESDAFDLVAAVDRTPDTTRAVPSREDSPILQTAESIGVSADVLIDFSTDEAAPKAVECARRAGAALLVGTTALSDQSRAAIERESAHRAVLIAPNTSLGVAVQTFLSENAARALSGFDCALVEAHHNQKKDSPSGTALHLARAIRDANMPLRDDQIVAIRTGDVVGEHTVRFAGPGEYIEITHRATSRDVFARGALRAAAWLRNQKSGLYTMTDVLGISP